MTERCPDHFPQDWVDPKVIQKPCGLIKEYDDGVITISDKPDAENGNRNYPTIYKTQYPPNGDLHYEYFYYDGDLVLSPIYVPDGLPENAGL